MVTPLVLPTMMLRWGPPLPSRHHYRVGIHLVWATKHRTPWLDANARQAVVALLGKILIGHGCQPLAVGAWIDHVHVYALLSPRLAVVSVVNLLKANSCRWIRAHLPGFEAFQWQRGYAAIGVDPRNDGRLRSYIREQEAVHDARQRSAMAPDETRS